MPDRQSPHADVHARRGFTVAVYFPPKAPWETVSAFLGETNSRVHALDRVGWDAIAIGYSGDLLRLDSDEQPGA
jgi:hypothetical protein